MAESDVDSGDRTEEATPERREEFRGRGQIAVSQDITSVFIMAAAVVCLSFYLPIMVERCEEILTSYFQRAAELKMTPENVLNYLGNVWIDWILLIIPLALVTVVTASSVTLAQTRFNWSWKKLKPEFSRLNPLKGVLNLVNTQALMNLFKGIGKMCAVSFVAFLILYSERFKVPGLMLWSLTNIWNYWGEITKYLFWATCALLLVLGAADYLYNFLSLEKKLKMTKQEVKEDYKKREGNPLVKAKIKRMQRDIAMSKAISATKEATVLITNPTHYAIALKYELGMGAPVVLAKGQDYMALRMREVAREEDITIVENKPLARTLYKVVEVGEEIPESLFKAVSEIIRYVFKLKGKALTRS
ncbi:MAG: flagellar biosynthesis protein FlhB [Zetaproteobacteria bacterium]|nr:flagellar biosynthesis protein FlhB [Pseudobdellovibrionaceae bacterium]